jgi:hypothetical protein
MPEEVSTALMTVLGKGGPPSRADAADQLGVEPEDVDATYGAALVDAEQGVYAVMVRADRLPPGKLGERYLGPFSNLKIGPFSPAPFSPDD